MEILMACATTRSKYDTPTKEPDLFFVNTFLDSLENEKTRLRVVQEFPER